MSMLRQCLCYGDVYYDVYDDDDDQMMIMMKVVFLLNSDYVQVASMSLLGCF